ncbi:hypothetical protein KK083_28970 [Fulvivirgaceae bacterium PWU4]|uniref:Outer membrane protein beta-barrel domain-containing protein n=1 Tax=Chryseosolibacter histidini TaxID=2782349 RepID=A0AAP2GSB9_9BACT|nr:hypothetical protein [Chryseosolibacter histidini]MBT1700960.1 hypothetical protein [Chryseosolibacter histidini]
MSKKNEDSLERFFRKAVTQHDTAFRENDWLKMEKMLDEKAAERAALRLTNLKRVGYSLAGLAIILTGIYFLTLNGNASMSTEEVLPKQMQVAAGEEAPVTDHTMEKPAAGLHSAQPQANNDSQKESNNTESLTGENPATSQSPASEEAVILKENNTTSLAQSQTKMADVDKGTAIGKRPIEKGTQQANVSGQSQSKATDVDKGSAINKQLIEKGTARADGSKLQPQPLQDLADQKTGTGRKMENTGDLKNTAISVVPTDNTSKTGPSRQQPAGALENQERKDVAASSEKETEDLQKAADVTKKTGALPVAEDPSRITALDDRDKQRTQDEQARQQVIDPATQDRAAKTAPADNGIAPEPEKAPLKQIEKDSVAAAEAVEETMPPDEKLKPVPTRWNVALVLAPDFSSTALERYTAPGEAYGFAVGYRFLDRFTVTTGLVRSTKKYVGYGSDYQPPEGYWNRRTNGIVPDDITGKCGILEIPLAVQYAFRQREKSRMYVAAGVSSYIMLHESYRYSFDAPNPGAARGWSTSKSSRYPFAIGHVSAAYERNLSQRWAIGLEPFLKIPFAGVGWSNVDLYSTGVFVNLRYRFFRKQQFTVPEERKQPIK